MGLTEGNEIERKRLDRKKVKDKIKIKIYYWWELKWNKIKNQGVRKVKKRV